MNTIYYLGIECLSCIGNRCQAIHAIVFRMKSKQDPIIIYIVILECSSTFPEQLLSLSHLGSRDRPLTYMSDFKIEIQNSCAGHHPSVMPAGRAEECRHITSQQSSLAGCRGPTV